MEKSIITKVNKYPNGRNGLMGKKHSLETKKKMSLSAQGNKNNQWKGDAVGLCCLHKWVKRHKPVSLLCEECGLAPPVDLANISQEYKRDINDFEWLCRRCHMLKDGRMKNLKQFKNG